MLTVAIPLVPAGVIFHAVPLVDVKSRILAPAPTYVLSEETATCADPVKLVAVIIPDITASVAFNRVIVALVPTKSVFVYLVMVLLVLTISVVFNLVIVPTPVMLIFLPVTSS